jgi:hypothetical protein
MASIDPMTPPRVRLSRPLPGRCGAGSAASHRSARPSPGLPMAPPRQSHPVAGVEHDRESRIYQVRYRPRRSFTSPSRRRRCSRTRGQVGDGWAAGLQRFSRQPWAGAPGHCHGPARPRRVVRDPAGAPAVRPGRRDRLRRAARGRPARPVTRIVASILCVLAVVATIVATLSWSCRPLPRSGAAGVRPADPGGRPRDR